MVSETMFIKIFGVDIIEIEHFFYCEIYKKKNDVCYPLYILKCFPRATKYYYTNNDKHIQRTFMTKKRSNKNIYYRNLVINKYNV